MVANQLEQRSVIKFFVVIKWKLCEIYIRMCDVYGEASFSEKRNVYKWVKYEPESKRQSMERKH